MHARPVRDDSLLIVGDAAVDALAARTRACRRMLNQDDAEAEVVSLPRRRRSLRLPVIVAASLCALALSEVSRSGPIDFGIIEDRPVIASLVGHDGAVYDWTGGHRNQPHFFGLKYDVPWRSIADEPVDLVGQV